MGRIEYPLAGMGYSPLDRTTEGVLATWRVVCLLRSRRRAFLFAFIILFLFRRNKENEIANYEKKDRKLNTETRKLKAELHVSVLQFMYIANGYKVTGSKNHFVAFSFYGPFLFVIERFSIRSH